VRYLALWNLRYEGGGGVAKGASVVEGADKLSFVRISGFLDGWPAEIQGGWADLVVPLVACEEGRVPEDATKELDWLHNAGG